MNPFVSLVRESDYYIRIFLVFLSIAVLYYAVHNTSFLPFQDEIDDYLDFVASVALNPSIDVLSLFESSFRTIHNVSLHKLIYLVQYKVLGYLDFRLLLVFGVGLYLVFLYLIIVRLLKSHPWYQVIMPCILLYVPIYKFHNWGMVSFIQGTLFLLTFIASGLLFKHSFRSSIAFVFILFLSITLGTGIIVLIVVFCLGLLYRDKIRLSRWIMLVTAGLYAILIYLSKTGTENQPTQISDYLNYFKDWLAYVLASYGSLTQYFLSTGELHYSIYFGAFILLFFFIVTYLNREKILSDPILSGIILFLIIVPVAGAIHRSFYGFRYALLEKFLMYPTIVIFLILVYLPEILNDRFRVIVRYFSLFLVLITGYYGVSSNHNKIVKHKKVLESGYVHLIANPEIEWLFRNDGHGKRFVSRMSKALNLGLFRTSELGMKRVFLADLNWTGTGKISVDFSLKVEDGHLFVYGRNYMKPLPNYQETEYYISINYRDNIHAFRLNQFERSLYGILDLDTLPGHDQEFDLFLSIKSNGKILSYPINYVLSKYGPYSIQSYEN